MFTSYFDLTVTEQVEKLPLRRLPSLRLALTIAGLLVLGGLALAYFAHPYFLILPALVGGGLTFSGTTGVCPMIGLVERLPRFAQRSGDTGTR